jgi:hypothetical protein
MFYTNTTTLLLLHEDRVNDLQKMHEPLPLLNLWRDWRKPKPQQEPKQVASSSTTIRKKEVLTISHHAKATGKEPQ